MKNSLSTKQYKEKRSEIIARMFQVLMRAQRKIDDKKYRQILQQFNKQ